MDTSEIILRLGIATAAGLLLGLDRELRGISAGIRTHALVAMSSALITVSALILYDDLRASGQPDLDQLRVVQGLALGGQTTCSVTHLRPGGPKF